MPLRSVYFLVFLATNVLLITLIVHYNPAWYVKLVLALVIGQLNTSMAFFAHEALHGSVFKSKFLQDLVGFVAFTPFLLSPTYWRHWHNTLHHGNTQLIFKDPDAFPSLSVFKRSRFMKVVFKLSPGSKNVLSYFYLFYWFSLQALINQVFMRFRNKMWANINHARVTKEFLVMVLIASSYIYWVGVENLLWLVIIPFLIQNYVMLSYIVTNHNISPLTKINDPLVNSLTVTNNRLNTFLHLNFGYHVEHHLFPRVSPAHAKNIHHLLIELYPDKYQHMPKWKALKYLYLTPRIYKNNEELIHPKSLKVYQTIG